MMPGHTAYLVRYGTVARTVIMAVCATACIYGSRVYAAGALSCNTLRHDTLRHDTLRAVTVEGSRVRTFLRPVRGASVVSMEMMRDMPCILGNADPIHYAQMLPGVQTNGEYDAGMHIQGCDNQHNMISLSGVPIYNVSHMLGFFSIFNATHYSDMRLDKSAGSAAAANRLGGFLDMRHSGSLPERLGGDLSVGPMSAQATLRLPLGKRSAVVVSAREAYLNLFYSPLLKIEDEQIRYGFGDYNLTFTCTPDAANTVWVDAYFGHDNVSYSDGMYGLDTSLDWGNLMASAHWRRNTPAGRLYQCVYFTGYGNRFRLEQTNVSVALPSAVSDIAYKLSFETGGWEVGADMAHHTIKPQSPEVGGVVGQRHAPQPVSRAVESSVYAGYTGRLAPRLTLSAGLRASLYHTGHRTFAGADPVLSLTVATSAESSLTLQGCIKHQYMHKTGFSNVGLPTEFWFPADATHRPQYSAGGSLTFDTYLFRRGWRVSAEAYFKRLYHQLEYVGNVFDFVYTGYSLSNMLISGNGCNYGINLLVEKRKGRITGWLGYSLGRAMRRFPGTKYEGTYPASHERIHELNMVATYRLSGRWSFGATVVAASGTPYTKPEKFYLQANHVVTQFGPHNGGRVDPYFRLDLSANYDFRTRAGRRSGINLSLYNATMHSNTLFYRLKVYKDKFACMPFRFMLRVMPSVSYYCSF